MNHSRLLPLLCLTVTTVVSAAERPNVVWIVSEDNSVHYVEHFMDGGASMPAVEGMAAHGLTFTHAFSNAPVCSVARTTLATMCYAPRIGTQFHRKYVPVPLPTGNELFTQTLMKAGYYCTNNSKTDYNVAVDVADAWNESSKRASWKNRPKGRPFFHMQSHTQTHESSLHFNRNTFERSPTTADPESVRLPPYLPDTPLARYTHARYLDNHAKIDRIVANTLADLSDAGVLEDTFVFYFGDHGGVLPRGKGYVYESGLHVPLVVRVPENFTHLTAGLQRGDAVAGFVSFIDFGATVLHLSGLKPAGTVDGQPFLGPGVTAESLAASRTAFGYADRMDEKYDFVRSLRRGRFQYIRSFQPWLPDGLQNNYRYRMLAYQQWREHYRTGKLSAEQEAFFEPKPIEQLFDCQADPHQVNNLAGDPQHAGTLRAMRGQLRQMMVGINDLSFYPESYLADHAFEDPAGFGRDHHKMIERYSRVADLALRPFGEVSDTLVELLTDEDPLIRYWAVMAASALGTEAAPLTDAIRPLLDDDEEIVRLRAAEFLGLTGAIDPQPVLAELVNDTSSSIFATEALNSVVFFEDRYPVDAAAIGPMANEADVDRRLEYLRGGDVKKK